MSAIEPVNIRVHLEDYMYQPYSGIAVAMSEALRALSNKQNEIIAELNVLIETHNEEVYGEE